MLLLLQIKADTPVLLCSVTGYDASGRVDDLAAQQSKKCTSIAIGQPHISIDTLMYMHQHTHMCTSKEISRLTPL